MQAKDSINTLRVLSCDMINKANSGHPGICLGAAPILYAIFNKNLKGYSKDPNWFARDRFILSAGHGSALLYSLYHLLGYKISLDDLKNFRQINSLTPGHPEYGHTDGVEATTGPLGQGIAMSVGLAISYKNLKATFNQPGFKLFDNYIYCLCGDGDLQEGISYEAISLAGHFNLNNLIVLYDSNNIQLDGKTELAFSDDIKKRFESANWNYQIVSDGNDHTEIRRQIKLAKISSKPTIIEIKTKIGFSSSNENTNKVHGSPLGDDVNVVRENLKYTLKPFEISDDVYQDFKNIYDEHNKKDYEKSMNMLLEYEKKYPELYLKFKNFKEKKYRFDMLEYFNLFKENPNVATRVSGGEILKKLTYENEFFIGGSADLSASTKVSANSNIFSKDDYKGRNLFFGVREHAMAAIANGISLSGFLRPFIGGFFVFSDYMKPAIRMSALMNLDVIYMFTHDSIFVGEDGPTHQPIEQLTALRAIPNLKVYRPASSNETVACFSDILKNKGPSVILLTRQNLKEIEKTNTLLNTDFKGSYIAKDEDKNKKLDLCLIATGSEVNLCIDAANSLDNLNIRVVSIPSLEKFEEQKIEYKKSIIPENTPLIACEASDAAHLLKYTNKLFNIKRFGLSGPSTDVCKKLGFDLNSLINFIKNNI